MYRKVMAIFCVLVLVSLTTTIVFAGKMRIGTITFSSATPTPTPGPGGSLVIGAEPEMSADVEFVPGLLDAEPDVLAGFEFVPGLLVAQGSVVGVGSQDVNLTLTATANIQEVNCRNQGGNQAPGQNPPKKITLTGNQTLSGGQSSDKNGKVPFGVVAGQLQTQLAGVCPNGNWDVIATLCYANANVTITDPNNSSIIFLNQNFPFPLGTCN